MTYFGEKMALNGTFLVKNLDIYSALSMKGCIIDTTLLLFYLPHG